jgi:2-pyrone-4,6-dicarboxylate lactonase
MEDGLTDPAEHPLTESSSTFQYAECESHDPHPRSPQVKLPAGACDTHAHVCGPIAHYPLVPNRLYNPPEASLADYRHMLDTLGIERAVLVQPSVYGTDNRAMLDALKQDPQRLRAVAVLPFDVSRDDVQSLHAQGVRGVRCNIVDLKEGKGQLPLEGLRQLASTIGPFGWHIEFLMHVNEFDDLSGQLNDLGVPLVFGHLGYVPTDLGRTPGFEGLLELAHAGKAWIKLTAPNRLTKETFPYPSTASCADLLIREVPHRLLWGSDWPHVFIKSPMPNDGDLFNLFLGWLGGRDVMEDILVHHPAQLYGF